MSKNLYLQFFQREEDKIESFDFTLSATKYSGYEETNKHHFDSVKIGDVQISSEVEMIGGIRLTSRCLGK